MRGSEGAGWYAGAGVRGAGGGEPGGRGLAWTLNQGGFHMVSVWYPMGFHAAGRGEQ